MRDRKPINKSKYDIAKYWYGKCINVDGTISDDEGCFIFSDMGEPCCWACGRQFNLYDEERDLKKLWDKNDLERCHIIPDSLGGSNEESNLFLLCPKCHEESPDTTNKNAFFRWVYDKRKTHMFGTVNCVKLSADIDKELNRRGYKSFKEMFEVLPKERQDKLSVILQSATFSNYASSNTTSHGFHTNYNSIIIALVDSILHFYTKTVLE